MHRRVTRGLVVALLILTPLPARAYLEHPNASTRTATLGGAFVSIADDPSATIDNPGGLAGIATPSFLFTYRKPYGVDGLDEGFVAAAIPARFVALGASWFHRGLDGAISEDMVTVAAACDLKRTAEDASLSVGVKVDMVRVAVHDGAASTGASLGAGVLLRPFAFIGLGYAIHALNQPGIDLVEGGAGTPIRRSQAAGLSYYWQQRAVFTAEAREDADGVWRGHAGAELTVGGHLALRAGLDGSRATAGAGVFLRGVSLDLGMTSHETLGASYLISLRYSRPRKEAAYGVPR